MRAMETCVERVWLDEEGEVNLDITALAQYGGQGRCKEVECYGDTANKYREEVKIWARRINWRYEDCTYAIKIERKYLFE